MSCGAVKGENPPNRVLMIMIMIIIMIVIIIMIMIINNYSTSSSRTCSDSQRGAERRDGYQLITTRVSTNRQSNPFQ